MEDDIKLSDGKLALQIIQNYITRQKFVAKLLKDNFNINHAKEKDKRKVPGHGALPKNPEWKYKFHGIGCELTNTQTGEVVDFDYGDNGELGGFDDWKLSLFVREEIKLGKLPEKNYNYFSNESNWEKILHIFVMKGIVEKSRSLFSLNLYFLTEKENYDILLNLLDTNFEKQ
jgi:hypothetical protein